MESWIGDSFRFKCLSKMCGDVDNLFNVLINNMEVCEWFWTNCAICCISNDEHKWMKSQKVWQIWDFPAETFKILKWIFYHCQSLKVPAPKYTISRYRETNSVFFIFLVFVSEWLNGLISRFQAIWFNS